MKQIPLTQMQFAIVDDNDFEELNKHKWYATKTTYGGFMAIRHIGKYPQRKTIYMHRQIMSCPQGMDIDHINHQTLDNCRENLRICTRSQNQMNSKPQQNCTSKYKGVHWYKNKKKWQAHILLNYKQIHLGYFNNEIDAAKAYDKAAVKLFGEFARPNS